MSAFTTKTGQQIRFSLSFDDPKNILMTILDPHTDTRTRVEIHHDDAVSIANAMMNAALDAERAPPNQPVMTLHPRAETLLSNINPRYWYEEI